MQVLLGGLCEKLVYYFEVHIFNRKNREGNTTRRAQNASASWRPLRKTCVLLCGKKSIIKKAN
jgi:hypothetical protein